MAGRIAVARTAQSLARALFSLEEPWRSRFLALMADRVGSRTSDRQPLTVEEVTTWLDDPELRRQVEKLLDAWPGAGEETP